MSSQPQLLQPGDVVDGKYRVERLLGRGGMGAVFVVRHVQTQRPLALKCMLAGLIGDYEAEQRFIREAQLSGNVDHPGVVATYDIGRHEGSLYMVMELLSGESLGQRIRRGAIEVGAAAHIMMDVLDAVAAAHAKSVVHRDLKPDNIFLHRGPDGRGVEPKILDFGISKAITGDGNPTMGLTKTGMVLGTPLYMSPEQVRGSKDVDHRTDVYALGVILYEMVTGAVPYNGNNFADLVLKIVTGNCDPPSARTVDVPPAFDAVVMRAMHPDLDARFADVKSFARALSAFAVAPGYPSQLPRGASSAPANGQQQSSRPVSAASLSGVSSSRVPSSRVPVTVSAQNPTPFSVESFDMLPPVKPMPWPAIAAAAVAVGAGLWLWLSDADQTPVADGNVDPTALPNTVHAAQPPATPASDPLLVPAPRPAAVAAGVANDVPLGVSPDAVRVASEPAGRPHGAGTDPHARHGNTGTSSGRHHDQHLDRHLDQQASAPAVIAPTPAPATTETPRKKAGPQLEQLIDPFEQ